VALSLAGRTCCLAGTCGALSSHMASWARWGSVCCTSSWRPDTPEDYRCLDSPHSNCVANWGVRSTSPHDCQFVLNTMRWPARAC
jgi:hypothetical protein